MDLLIDSKMKMENKLTSLSNSKGWWVSGQIDELAEKFYSIEVDWIKQINEGVDNKIGYSTIPKKKINK